MDELTVAEFVTEKSQCKVAGEILTEFPKDLFIPPEALLVFLEAFEGPLDLLLYLIRKQNIDILDIPIATITAQYIAYVEVMREMQFELAGDYLVMAAILAEIKSRMLLPRSADTEEDELDPRAELVRRLQEYERYKQAAEDLDDLPREERDYFAGSATVTEATQFRIHPDVELSSLLDAMRGILQRAEMFAHHQVQREPLSVRERMSSVLQQLRRDQFTPFSQLFTLEEGRRGVVVTFMALLELLKQAMIELVQTDPFSEIFVKSAMVMEEQ